MYWFRTSCFILIFDVFMPRVKKKIYPDFLNKIATFISFDFNTFKICLFMWKKKSWPSTKKYCNTKKLYCCWLLYLFNFFMYQKNGLVHNRDQNLYQNFIISTLLLYHTPLLQCTWEWNIKPFYRHSRLTFL